MRGPRDFTLTLTDCSRASWYERTVKTEFVQEAPMWTLAKILYIASVLRARPRGIDRYIDYFGERVS
jgi:hypothetical protein